MTVLATSVKMEYVWTKRIRTGVTVLEQDILESFVKVVSLSVYFSLSEGSVIVLELKKKIFLL